MQKEEVINAEIGKLLKQHLHGADVRIEQNNQLADGAKRPDLVVKRDGREPLVVENKIDDVRGLTKQCTERLDAKWANGRPVRAVIGLLSPKYLAETGDSKLIAKESGFRWAVWGTTFGRFPDSGWLSGSVIALAGFIDRVGANAVDINQLIEEIRLALKQACLILQDDPRTSKSFSRILKQKPSQQTNRMGLAMIFNAIVFQAHIAKHHGRITSPSNLEGDQSVTQDNLARIWGQILEIDYSPIFFISRELLQSIADAKTADLVLKRLSTTAIATAKETGSQGLIGTIFGELISDRKLLASFYTMPTSSTLIAELAIDRLDINWGDRQAIENLRIGDLAVGTGTLLVASYQRIAERHLLSKSNPAKLHKSVMERVLIGCDIDPSAVHITAARLSGEFTSIDYYNTQTYVMPYGYAKLKKNAREYKLGSLDLLAETPQTSLFGSGLEALAPNGPVSHVDVDIPKESLDMVIMNPPFTRPTNHERFKDGFPNPQFAGLGNDAADQKKMSQILKTYLKAMPKLKASHGNAGLASNFMDLAHAKLKPGGVLALIVPSTLVSGDSWANMRELLARCYKDITIITIGGDGGNWSADTSLNEVIVIATKDSSEERTNNANFVVFRGRPRTIIEATESAKAIASTQGEGELMVGGNSFGWNMVSSFEGETVGHPSNVQSMDLAIFSRGLTQGLLSLPRAKSLHLPTTSIGQLGPVGPLDRDINGLKPDGSPRGPFDIKKLENKGGFRRASYPIIWSHNSKLETTLVVEPDSEGVVRSGHKQGAIRIWSGYTGGREFAGATGLHINRDFRLTSQSLGACLTPIRAIGGIAWPSFQLKFEKLEECEKAIVVWLNTTLGLIGRWWVSSRQQLGRARLNISTIPNIPVLDPNRISAEQLTKLAKVFDRYSGYNLAPANEADKDKVRQEMDQEVLCDILGLPVSMMGSVTIIRSQWCAEPSVKGS